jgi:eukaryotic-like serine/threonine-protein kinase
MARPEALLAAGEVIDERFLIEHLAGVGGMGAVYRAKDLATGGAVAVKAVDTPPGPKGERFVREAHMLAQLSHPAVVQYVAHGLTARGVPYLAMEWLDGEDLALRLARSGLTLDETLALMQRVCAGLAAAHDRGMTHRDIKPSNLFLVEGRVQAAKLLDFGVARQPGFAHTLTRAGSTLGTVGYMAPEQALDVRDVDARADVFALGCVLFECLTGRPPFEGQHEVAVLANLLRGDVPRIRELRPDIPEALDELVASLLAKDRARRPADAGALAAALRDLGTLRGVGAPSSRRSNAALVEAEQRIASVLIARRQLPAAATLAGDGVDVEAEQLQRIVQRFGAKPLPFGAGCLLLVFGSAQGVIASDQAVQAVRCALRLRSLMPQLQLGVGTGGLESTFDTSVGIAIDRALALLEQSPTPRAGVLVDELTAGLLHGGFALERSAGAPCVVTEVEDDQRPRPLLGKLTPCVGREKELGLLEATLRECSADQVARTLLITGQPGAGKSRLGREFLERVRAGALARVLIARADPVATRSPLYLLQRLLFQAFGLRDGDSALERESQMRAYLSELADASGRELIGEFLGELVGAPPLGEPSPLLRAARQDPAVMREQTRRALQQWLAAEAAQASLVIMLEDLQWADLPSIQWLEESVAALSDRAIFMIALARPDVREQVLRPFGSQELRLPGLTRRAAERLVREMLPASTYATIVARVVELADGNPFYLEELIRRVAEGGSELPETVRAIVRSRLEALPSGARRHLRAASVFGETSWVGGVRALLGDGADAAAWFGLLAREEIFVQRHQPRFPDQVEYVFRHALLRDAAYAMLSDEDRRAAHGLAGEWLETMGERDACVLADHFERAELPERALPWLLRAARLALDGGDLAAAIALGERGLALRAAGRERGELLLIQAHASAWGTRTNLELAKEALALLPSAGGSWWFALALLVFGSSATGRAELAEPYLELSLATPAPDEERIGAYGQAFEVLAVGAVLVGRPDIGWSMYAKFKQLVTRAPDYVSTAWLGLTQCQLATNSRLDGSWQLELAVRAGREAVSGMRAVGAVSGEATALFHLGIALRELGCYAAAERSFAESLERSLEAENSLIAEFSQLVLAVFALRAGKREQGERQLDRLAGSSDANIVHACQSVRAQALLHARAYERAAELAAEAAQGPGLLHRLNAALVLSRARLALGAPEAALEVLERAEQARGAILFPQLELDMHALHAEICRALGREDAAAQAARAAVRFVAETRDAIQDAELRAAFAGRARLGERVRSLAER